MRREISNILNQVFKAFRGGWEGRGVHITTLYSIFEFSPLWSLRQSLLHISKSLQVRHCLPFYLFKAAPVLLCVSWLPITFCLLENVLIIFWKLFEHISLWWITRVAHIFGIVLPTFRKQLLYQTWCILKMDFCAIDCLLPFCRIHRSMEWPFLLSLGHRVRAVDLPTPTVRGEPV